MHPRQIASEKGEKFYEGKSCKKCGNVLRYTSMTGCVNCTKENSVKRFENGNVKEWVQKNREKVNASNRKRYNSLSLEEKTNRNRFLVSIPIAIIYIAITFIIYDYRFIFQNI